MSTDFTPEAVAKGLVSSVDQSEPVIDGQDCVTEFVEAVGAEISFTVSDEDSRQHQFIATIRNDGPDVPLGHPGATQPVNPDERAADVDLVHNLILGGFAEDEDPLDRLGVEDDVIVLKAPGRVLRITVERS